MNTFHFDIRATRAYTAYQLRRFVEGPVAVVIIAIILIPIILHDLEASNFAALGVALGLLFFLEVIVHDFIAEKLESKFEKPLYEDNLACHLTSDIVKKLRKKPESAYGLLEAVMETKRGAFIVSKMGLDPNRLRQLAEPLIGDQDIKLLIEKSQKAAELFKEPLVDPGSVLYTLFQQHDVFEKLLNTLDLSLHDLQMIVAWEEFHNRVWDKQGFLHPSTIVRVFGGVGREWVTGYNDDLDRLTEDLSRSILHRAKRTVIVHLEKLKNALHILSRSSQNNMIVVGQPGAGKHSFIENIAYELRVNELKKGLAYTRVIVLQSQTLLSGTSNPDTFLLSALKRAEKQGRFILVIEDMGLFLRAQDPKVRAVLAKFLKAQNINIIGTADARDYHTLIKTDAALDSQFEKITLEGVSFSDTMSVVMESYFRLEDRKHVQVTYKALKSIVELAERYLTKGAFPGKAVDLLNDVVLNSRKTGDKLITDDDVRKMISLKAHIDIGKVGEKQRDALLHLSENMKKVIVGQEYALDTLANSLKRSKVDLGTRKRPIGTYLFLGPTGVGKTETAKVLAKEYFGTEGGFVRIDMNEYSTEESIAGIIGSSDPRAPAEGFLTQQVQDKPFSLVLLDEIEKAHPKVLNLFLQILDEGHLIDGQGTKTDFRHTIIIATSNAGAHFINSFIKEHPDAQAEDFKKALLDEILNQKIYSPEFLNRFDDIILYYPLTKEQSAEVAMRMIRSIVGELETSKGITLQIDDDAVRAIAERGYSTEFGAREMRRAVTDTLENFIADVMLRGDMKRGDVIPVTRGDLKL